jgi:hypothetical protein
MFLDKYTKVFSENYLMNYTKNQLPYIEEDAGIFDLEEIKKAKAQKFNTNKTYKAVEKKPMGP